MRFCFFPLLLLVLISCKFTPHENFDAEIEPKPTVQLSAIDLLKVKDTLLVYDYTSLTYNIDVQGNKSLKVSAKLDDKEILSSTVASGQFQISPSSLKDGVYPLKLSVLTNTGTGSLADKLKAEKLLFERTWTVLIDKDLPQPPKIISIGESTGRLRIEWEKYTRPNFSNYFVQVSTYPDTSYSCYRCDPKSYSYTIKDRNQTVLIDSNFVGGKIKVSIKVYPLGDKNYFPAATEVEFEDTRSRIQSFESLPGGKMKLTWNKNKYYANFTGYSLHQYDYYYSAFQKVNNINDTVFTTDKIGFGDKAEVVLVTASSPKFTSCCSGNLSARRLVYYGQKSMPYTNRIFTGSANLWYIITDTEIKSWQSGNPANSLKVSLTYYDPALNRYVASLAVSPDQTKLFIGYPQEIQAVNALDFTPIATYPTSNLMGAGTERAFQLTASGGEYIFFGLRRYVNRNETYSTVCYNTQSKTVTDTHYGNGYTNSLKVNKSGNCLIRGIGSSFWVTRVENGQFVGDASPVKLDGSQAQFNPLNEDEIYTFSPAEMRIYDAVTLLLKQKVSLDKTISEINVDQVSGNIGGFSTDGYYYCYNPQTGQRLAVQKLDRIYYASYSDPVRFDLHNNILYSNSGYKVKLAINQ